MSGFKEIDQLIEAASRRCLVAVPIRALAYVIPVAQEPTPGSSCRKQSRLLRRVRTATYPDMKQAKAELDEIDE